MPDIVPDMEDLLKRASDDYPLKESPDKWEDIASRLAAGKPAPQSAQPSGRKKYYALALLLLLFLCIGFYFINTGIHHTGSGERNHTTGSVKPGIQKQENPEQYKAITFPREKTAGWRDDDRQQDGRQDTDEKVGTKEKAGTKEYRNHQTDRIHYPARKTTVHTGTGNRPGRSIRLLSKNRKQKNGIGWKSDGDPAEQNRSLFTKSRPGLNGPAEKTGGTATGFNPHRFTDQLAPYEPLSINGEDIKIGPPSRRKFYYGITAGKSFSMVKGFGLQKNCFDYGLLAGYRLTGRLSVETGLLAVKKYYTSEGKDFSMEEMGAMMSSGMKLMEVEGSCRVVELPLNLRYDILTGKNKRFFSSAGVSSLIMTKEHNTYHTMMNGVSEKIVGTYTKDRRYVAAAFNLVAGYEQQLTRKIAIRLEPYIQIPIRGVGVGKLPLTSTGLRIGITRSAR